MFITNPQLPVYKIESLIIDGDLVLEPTECDDSIILMIKNGFKLPFVNCIEYENKIVPLTIRDHQIIGSVIKYKNDIANDENASPLQKRKLVIFNIEFQMLKHIELYGIVPEEVEAFKTAYAPRVYDEIENYDSALKLFEVEEGRPANMNDAKDMNAVAILQVGITYARNNKI